MPLYVSDFSLLSEEYVMARERLSMRKVKKVLAFHFDERLSARSIATQCGLARRSVGQTLKRFAASGLNWPEAADMDDAALEAALYPVRQTLPADEDVDWSTALARFNGSR